MEFIVLNEIILSRLLHKSKTISIRPLNERKLQKYVDNLLKYSKIDVQMKVSEVCSILIEKTREFHVKNNKFLVRKIK
jgi:hypothetical protein